MIRGFLVGLEIGFFGVIYLRYHAFFTSHWDWACFVFWVWVVCFGTALEGRN